MTRTEKAKARTAANKNARAQREFKRSGGVFGAICRFIFEV